MSDNEYVISDDIWENAIRNLKIRFSKSPNLEFCMNMIKDFEAANSRKKYKSDLDIFIRESKMEDFITKKLTSYLYQQFTRQRVRNLIMYSCY